MAITKNILLSKLRKAAAYPLRPWLGSVHRVETHTKVAALTFDDGPHAQYTPALLDILERYRAKATFFVVGESAAQHPELLERIVANGHALANHTWDHPSMDLLTRAKRREQLRRCAAALEPYGGDNKLFRPPYGNQSRIARLDAALLGYEVIAWTHHCYDWLEHDAEFLSEQMAKKLSPGSIFLLHDALYRTADKGAVDRTPSIKAVEELLKAFPEYDFVTVPELLARGKAQKAMWFKRSDKAWLERLDLAADL